MSKFVVSVALGLFASSAFAACPWPTKYQCYVAPSGKVVCGCI